MNLLDVCSAEEILYLLDVGRLTPEQLLEQVGFEWPNFTEVLAKMDEEMAELKVELGRAAPDREGCRD